MGSSQTVWVFGIQLAIAGFELAPVWAQDTPPQLPRGEIQLPAEDSNRPSILIPSEAIPPEPLPPEPLILEPSLLDRLLENPPAPQPRMPETTGPTVYVDSFQLVGSTVFTEDDFAALFAQYRERQLTFGELTAVATAVTQRYIDQGYLTSSAFIPLQTVTAGVVTIQVTEGRLENITITGTDRLEPDYVRSRLGRAASPPLNVKSLLAALQKLQRDPLIETIAANLQAGTEPGGSWLEVTVVEADPLEVTINLDNHRSPNVGSLRRQLEASEHNLIGIGDRISLGYARTDGSSSLDLAYSVPLSPTNTRLTLAAGISDSHVIASEFENFDIGADGFYLEVEVNQPLIATPTQELSLELRLTHQQNQLRLGEGSTLLEFGKESDFFPVLSPGSNADGKTRLTALRFAQTWFQRRPRQIMAARSQFSLGLGLFDASQSAIAPDSRFLAWRGQAQWIRRLTPNALFLLRGSVQLTTTELLVAEQFSLGGPFSIRGYRQDALLRDNGASLSAEARLPLLQAAAGDGRLQVTPFIYLGTAWNQGDTSSDTLVGIGLGLLWQQGDTFSARLDWGIPLVDVPNAGDSLQDSGIYFSIRYTPF